MCWNSIVPVRSRKHVCLLLAITCVVHFLQRCFSFAWHCLGSCIHTTNAHSSKAAYLVQSAATCSPVALCSHHGDDKRRRWGHQPMEGDDSGRVVFDHAWGHRGEAGWDGRTSPRRPSFHRSQGHPLYRWSFHVPNVRRSLYIEGSLRFGAIPHQIYARINFPMFTLSTSYQNWFALYDFL